jgi:hypothetical protein
VTFKELLMMMTMLEPVIDRTGTGTSNVPFPEFGGFLVGTTTQTTLERHSTGQEQDEACIDDDRVTIASP